MSHPSIALDFFESLDVVPDLSFEIVFQSEGFHMIQYLLLLFFSNVFDLFHEIDIELIQDRPGSASTNTKNLGKTYSDRFVVRYDVSQYPQHMYTQRVKLALSKLLPGICPAFLFPAFGDDIFALLGATFVPSPDYLIFFLLSVLDFDRGSSLHGEDNKLKR